MNQNRHYFSADYPYTASGSNSRKDPAAYLAHDMEYNMTIPEKPDGYEQPLPKEWEASSMAEQIKNIQEKLTEIEEKYTKLKETIEHLKPMTVENVHYKIQDLHVQDLSGTLHVGLTTLSDAEQLQKLLAESDSIQFSDMDTEECANQWTETGAFDNRDDSET